jgi:hypothetical protein
MLVFEQLTGEPAFKLYQVGSAYTILPSRCIRDITIQSSILVSPSTDPVYIAYVSRPAFSIMRTAESQAENGNLCG